MSLYSWEDRKWSSCNQVANDSASSPVVHLLDVILYKAVSLLPMSLLMCPLVSPCLGFLFKTLDTSLDCTELSVLFQMCH